MDTLYFVYELILQKLGIFYKVQLYPLTIFKLLNMHLFDLKLLVNLKFIKASLIK